MKLYSFEYVHKKFLEKFNKDSSSEIKTDSSANENKYENINKIRDKYTEIINLIGIDKDLLKNKSSIITADNINLKKGSYIFPEDSINFCISLLEKFTTKDFKLLRKGKLQDINLDELSFIYNGFKKMLQSLECPISKIFETMSVVDRKLLYSFRILSYKLDEELSLTKYLFKKLNDEPLLLFEDIMYISFFWIYKLKKINDFFNKFIGEFITMRNDLDFQNYGQYDASVITNEMIELDIKEMKIFSDLQENKEYQKILKKIFELAAEEGYISQKSSQYNKLKLRLEEIRKSLEIELFGEELEKIQTPEYLFTHPMEVLIQTINEHENIEKNAIAIKEKNAQIQYARNEKYIAMAEELIKKYKKGKPLSEIPRNNKDNDEIFLRNALYDLKIIDTVRFPCCPREKISILENTKGKAIVICPNCHERRLIDYSKKCFL